MQKHYLLYNNPSLSFSFQTVVMNKYNQIFHYWMNSKELSGQIHFLDHSCRCMK